MENPERKLRKLETEFGKIVGRRAPKLILKSLAKGGKPKVNAATVSRESRTHIGETKRMLALIDKYAEHHQRIHGEVILPKTMAIELERLSQREFLRPHPQLPKTIARAFQTHRNRLDAVFSQAETIRMKYKITVARATRSAA